MIYVISRGVYFGDYNVVTAKLIFEFLLIRCSFFAQGTPRCLEVHQHIIAFDLRYKITTD